MTESRGAMQTLEVFASNPDEYCERVWPENRTVEGLYADLHYYR